MKKYLILFGFLAMGLSNPLIASDPEPHFFVRSTSNLFTNYEQWKVTKVTSETNIFPLDITMGTRIVSDEPALNGNVGLFYSGIGKDSVASISSVGIAADWTPKLINTKPLSISVGMGVRAYWFSFFKEDEEKPEPSIKHLAQGTRFFDLGRTYQVRFDVYNRVALIANAELASFSKTEDVKDYFKRMANGIVEGWAYSPIFLLDFGTIAGAVASSVSDEPTPVLTALCVVANAGASYLRNYVARHNKHFPFDEVKVPLFVDRFNVGVEIIF
ncbi:MAG: hypothetical protein FWG85_01075 [Bacteroidetes bacterium]|nr:hypothetical protein [Bacteroidota bacterium]